MARIQYSSRCCVRSLSSKDAFRQAGELTTAANCSQLKRTVISRLKEAGLRTRHALVEPYSLTNRRSDQQTMGRFWFTDHRERVTTLKTFSPSHAAQVLLHSLLHLEESST
jgi:hypothetical protein